MQAYVIHVLETMRSDVFCHSVWVRWSRLTTQHPDAHAALCMQPQYILPLNLTSAMTMKLNQVIVSVRLQFNSSIIASSGQDASSSHTSS